MTPIYAVAILKCKIKCRWRVFYRVLGPTIAMVLSPGNQNAFSSLAMLDQVVKVVTVNGRAPELQPDRVQRKFAEVCGLGMAAHFVYLPRKSFGFVYFMTTNYAFKLLACLLFAFPI